MKITTVLKTVATAVLFKGALMAGMLSSYNYITPEETAKLVREDAIKVVIVCPRGAGGADRTYDFFLEKGLKKEQLFTLKNGQEGWPREQISDVIVK